MCWLPNHLFQVHIGWCFVATGKADHFWTYPIHLKKVENILNAKADFKADCKLHLFSLLDLKARSVPHFEAAYSQYFS